MCWQGRRFWVEQCKEDGGETGDEELGYGDENAVNALFKEDISIRLTQDIDGTKANAHAPR